MNHRIAGLVIIALAILIGGCRPSKNATRISVNDSKATPFLVDQLKQNEFRYDWISAKFEADITMDSNNTSFNATMRGRKDSVLWFSISPALGIEVARVMLTRDSVKIVDRVNSKYFAGNYSYLSKMLKTDVDFNMIQDLLIGNSVSLDTSKEKLKSSVDKRNNRYLLSSVSKRKVKKAIRKEGAEDPLESIWLEPENFKIAKLLIVEQGTSKRSLEANYSEFKPLDAQKFPHKIMLKIIAEKVITANLEYSKVGQEKILKVPFNIPEKYERMF